MELLIAETEIVGKEEMAPMEFDWWPEATWRWWVEKKRMVAEAIGGSWL
jgi:hypothetical protein